MQERFLGQNDEIFILFLLTFIKFLVLTCAFYMLKAPFYRRRVFIIMFPLQKFITEHTESTECKELMSKKH